MNASQQQAVMGAVLAAAAWYVTRGAPEWITFGAILAAGLAPVFLIPERAT